MTAHVFPTPLGWMAAAAHEDRLTTVILPQEDKHAVLAALTARGATASSAGSPVLERFQADVTRYFSGEPVDFSDYAVTLDGLTPFQQAALNALRKVPAGEVQSYRWIAQQAGRPGAARAAGQAMHANPLPLVLPCHRVVGANGTLTGFGGGLDLKRKLLSLEGVVVKNDRVAVLRKD